MSGLLELAERCEAASGPDRRLSAEIEIAIGGFPERAFAQRNAMRPRGSPALDRLEWAAEWFGNTATASLDAAVKLVPEGREWNCEAWPQPSAVHKGARATAWVCGARRVYAATPALALTAAALRARAAGVPA